MWSKAEKRARMERWRSGGRRSRARRERDHESQRRRRIGMIERWKGTRAETDQESRMSR